MHSKQMRKSKSCSLKTQPDKVPDSTGSTTTTGCSFSTDSFIYCEILSWNGLPIKKSITEKINSQHSAKQ